MKWKAMAVYLLPEENDYNLPISLQESTEDVIELVERMEVGVFEMPGRWLHVCKHAERHQNCRLLNIDEAVKALREQAAMAMGVWN